jgi:tetratricopeptide (TPR) repeat protein
MKLHNVVATLRRIGSVVKGRTYVASPSLTEPIFSVQSSLAVCQQDLEEALRVTDSIEWRAFAQYMAGWMFASFGALGAALSSARAALEIALEIENRQWIVGSYNSTGDVYLSLLDPFQALEMLEAGLEVASALGSAFYLGNITASLAQAYLLIGDLPRAESILAQAISPEQDPRNLQERRMLWAWGELALRLADNLLSTAPCEIQGGDWQPIPMLLKWLRDCIRQEVLPGFVS